MINHTLKSLTFAFVVICVCVSGCTPTPSLLENSEVEIQGQPNETVYVSYDLHTFKSENGATSESSSGAYGPKQLDETGKLVLQFDQEMHGLKVLIVNLNNDPVSLQGTSDDESKNSAATGKLDIATLEFGWQPKSDPDDHKNNIEEARQYLPKNAAESTATSDDT